MNAKSKVGSETPKPILKGVLVHGQPHALVRPGRPGNPVTNKSGGTELEQVRASAYAQGRAAREAEEAQALELAFAKAREQGFEAGHRSGIESGLAKGQAEAKLAMARAATAATESARERIHRLESLMASAQASAEALKREAEDDLVSMSFEIACRIVGEKAVLPSSMREIARRLLADSTNAPGATLHVHPDDYRALLLDADVDGERNIHWVPDSAVELGGMILRSQNATLDARLETQIRALQITLARHREQRKSGGDR